MVQDEVVGEIVKALAGRLPAGHGSSRRRTTNLEAYELFVRGRMLSSVTGAETKASRPLLHRAIELDPGFAEAYAWLAMSHHFGWAYCGEPEENRGLARAAARKAVTLDPENVDAHVILGYIRAYDDALTEGVAEIEAALALNPNHAEGWSLIADLRVLEGRPVEAIECARKAIRLDPHPRGDYYWLLGWGQYAAGRYADAVDTLHQERARAQGVRRILAAALAKLGRIDEAREEAHRFLLESPQFSAREWGRTQPFRNDADRQHFIEGYIAAGLPE
jgi:adenylate cyclase